jgi:DNA-binding XRE family transcriptional regulator
MSHEGGVQVQYGDGMIDWAVFGGLMKTARKAHGYSRGRDLAEAIWDKTGVKVSEKTLYSIEAGEYPPKVDVFLAMQQVMPHLFNADYIAPAIRKSKRD